MAEEFNIDANTIKKLIANVSGGLSKDKNSILSNYLVNIKDSAISITSSNSVVQINTSAPINSENECAFLVKPDLFERLKALSGDIFFELKENLLTIKNGFYKTTAKVLDTQGYPMQSIDGYKMACDFETNDILELLKANIASSKEEEITREFNGVLIDINQNLANFVSTNRSRLFWISKQVEDDINFYCIAEKDSLLHLKRILKANNKVNLLYKSDGENITSIAFQMTDCVIISKTIKGKFPQYQAVTIDKSDNAQCVTFDKELLKTALQRVLALNNEELSVVEINIQENNAQLNITNKEGETANDVVGFESCKHTPAVLAINGRYALDFLNNIQSDSVSFYYKEVNKPVEFKLETETVINYVYIMTSI